MFPAERASGCNCLFIGRNEGMIS